MIQVKKSMEDAIFVAFCGHFIADVFSSEESFSESDTTKAVKCFNIFNHDSWPENQEDLVDHSADDHAFLLDHFSTVLRR